MFHESREYLPEIDGASVNRSYSHLQAHSIHALLYAGEKLLVPRENHNVLILIPFKLLKNCLCKIIFIPTSLYVFSLKRKVPFLIFLDFVSV